VPVKLTRQVTKQCPFRDETDNGTLMIIIPGDAPELHELARKIDGLSAHPISHEAYTRIISGLLPPGSRVITRWQTGPWKVEVTQCSISPRQVPVPHGRR